MDTAAIAAPPRRCLTIVEFGAEGTARFGPDIANWAFECPDCGTVSAAKDFPEGCSDRVALAAVECIGRHVEGRGCRRIAYSLDPGPWLVTLASGAVVASFPFADALSEPLRVAQEIDGTGAGARAEEPPAPHAAPACALSSPEPGSPDPAAEPTALRPYWTAEEGWTDTIGCSCHIAAPCSPCESLQLCPRCDREVLVPECDMAAHQAEVHVETTESET